jgi:peptide deformylase
MIKEIVKIGTDVLREKSKPAENNEKTKEIIQNLKDTLLSIPNGAGLAAPQINESLQIFVTRDYKNDIRDNILVFVNPEIIEYSELKVSIPDGCLSIPNVSFMTQRSSFLKVKYFNENFEEVEEELSGFQSVVFQHEYDHLNGILFIDRLEEKDKYLYNQYLNRKEKGENVIVANNFIESKIIEMTFVKNDNI